MSDSNYWKIVPGAQVTMLERKWLRSTAVHVESKFGKVSTIVNIGVMWGCSMHCLRAGAISARLVGIDNDYAASKVLKPGLLKAEFIEGDSKTVKFADPIHFLFVDGDHHYNAVKADIENWASRIVVGGIIAFHDYAPTACNLKLYPHLEGVKRAADELAENSCWHRYDNVGSIIAFERRK